LVERDALIAGQAARIAELESVVADLRARLDQNSRNSSKPPSSDGYAKPSANKKRSLRRKSGRKPGGQSGHRGRHLERREDPDRTVVHPVERCECCGRDVRDQPIVESQSRQVFDLPEMPRLDCVEHWVQKRRCECGHLASSSFPAEVSAPACYGPRIRALGIYLVTYQHLPFKRAAEILSDWARAPISVGTLLAFVAYGADGLDGFLEEIRGQLVAADVAHFDETGGRIAGALSWIHCASSDRLTLYTVHDKRGRDGIDAAGVLPGFQGTAVHDGWAPYRLYEQARHALCGAHHLRELLGAEELGECWAIAMGALLLDAKQAVEEAVAAGEDRLSDEALAVIRECYRDVIKAGHEQHPGLDRDHGGARPKRTKAQNLLLRLQDRENEVLRFAADFQVPFDNNLCERDLRMVKLQQKISGCWRTSEGAERFLRIRSYISTARKQDQPPVEVLLALSAGRPWQPQAAGP